MRKKHTNKIRATFYIDKELYQLLKRCSAIENIPMSSIINDDLLEDRVGKYRHATVKDWESYEYHKSCELADEEERQHDHEDSIPFFGFEEWLESAEGQYDTEKSKIEGWFKKGKITEGKKKILLEEAKLDFEMKLEEEKKHAEELSEHWKKVCLEIPLK